MAAKSEDAGTISRNVTLETKTHDTVEQLRNTKSEKRSFSSMVDILICEALAARKIKGF
jgi:hypothetical protein